MKSISFWLLVVSFIVILTIGFLYYLNLYQFNTLSQKPCEVYVYTYSSFASMTGPGKQIQSLFKEKTDCDAHLENIGDARMILQRLNSEMKIKSNVDADVVLGLDQFSIQQAYSILKWKKIDYSFSLSERLNEIKLSEEELRPFGVFIPLDWSPLTFIYRSDESDGFKNLQDIFTSDIKYALMDPRSSSPGFQFLVWVQNEFGQDTLLQFINKALMISPSWTTAYGLFTKKQTQIAFSYLTSLAYHWIEEDDQAFQAMQFESGHPYQIEFAGIIENSPRLDTALKFLKFLLLEEVQRIIMTKNYMFPVVQGVEKSTPFANLPKLHLIKNYKLQRTEKDYLQSWKNLIN